LGLTRCRASDDAEDESLSVSAPVWERKDGERVAKKFRKGFYPCKITVIRLAHRAGEACAVNLSLWINRPTTMAAGKKPLLVSSGDERSEPISTSGSERTPRAGELIPSQMCKQYHVTFRALRFYEEEGLISSRRAGGWRFYDKKGRERLEMILLGKELGFSLAEIKETIDNANADDSIGFEQLLLDEQILEQIRFLELRREEINGAITKLRENLSRRRQG
jgi:DNA-binding transcriptional MerR regulator